MLIAAEVEITARPGRNGDAVSRDQLEQRIAAQAPDDQAPRFRTRHPHARAAPAIRDVIGDLVELLTAGTRHGPDPGRDAVRVRPDDGSRPVDLRDGRVGGMLVDDGQAEVTGQVMPAKSSPEGTV